jgi:hypothetical protein
VEQVIAATTTTTSTTSTTVKKNPQIAAGTTIPGTTIPGTTTTSTTVRPPSVVGTPSTTSTTTSTSSTTTSSTTTTIPINCSGLQLNSNDFGGNPPQSYMYLTLNSYYAADECYPASVTVRYYRDGNRTNEYASSQQSFSLNQAFQVFNHVCPAGSSGLTVFWTATATRTAPFNYGTWSANPYSANSINC